MDRGLQVKQTKITKNLDGLQQIIDMTKHMRARVGILGNKVVRTNDTEIDNSEIAFIQIFGSITDNIPPRDFLVQPLMHERRELVKAMSGSMVRNAFLAGNYQKMFKLLGAAGEAAVQKAFETAGFGQWPPNAPLTIARKGSAAPLIDQGILRNSVTSDVVEKSQA